MRSNIFRRGFIKSDQHVQEVAPKPLFIVAEYWSHEVDKLQTYIDRVEGKTMLFDAPLQMKFHEASRMGRDYDMTQIFTGTLVEADPFHAVTLVANHDTQQLSPRSTGRTVV